MNYDEQVKAVLEKYGTSRIYSSKASDSGYYDFMIGETKIHIRFSDHFKDAEDEKDYHITIVKAGDAYVLRYRKLTITKSAEEFPRYLESFLFIFPDMFRIVEGSLEQVEQNCQQYLSMKTQYERLRKEYNDYKELHRSEEELVGKIQEKDKEINNLNNIKNNLESSVRGYKDKIRKLESDIPGFLLLDEIKNTYGQVIESANLGLMKIKELRKNLENDIK